VTTLPAPTTVSSPIVTPGQTMAPPPSQAPSSTVIGSADSQPRRRVAASSGWVGVNNCMPVAICTSAPIVTRATSRITGRIRIALRPA
jgi:hypothetical protein